MALVLILSTLAMIFLASLNVLSYECMHDEDQDCSALLKFPSTQFGLLVEFLADIVPGIAFMYVNRPTDFMVDFNKYPDNNSRVSIIQFHDHKRYYTSEDIEESVPRNHGMSKLFGINILKG